MRALQINQRVDIPELIRKWGKQNVVFTVGLRPRREMIGIVYTSAADELDMVDAMIDETLYSVKDGYKVTLQAIDPLYGHHHFYISDLESLIEQGCVIYQIME